MSRLPVLLAALIAGALAALLVACGGGDGDKGKDTGSGSKIPTVTAKVLQPTVPVSPSASEADAPCAPGAGKTIPAVAIAAVNVPAKTYPGTRLKDGIVPAVRVPGVHLAARRVPEQCARIEQAPAGCLGAVHIPATTIPGAALPGVRVPGYHAHGIDIDGDTAPPDVAQPDHVGAENVAGECVEKVKPGDLRPSILRASALRASLLRASLLRPSLLRASEFKDGKSIPALSVPAVSVPAVSVPAVSIPAAVIAAKVLPEVRSKCIKVLAGAGQTDYAVCTDVLFAFGKATLRAQAKDVLRQVAGSIRKRSPKAKLLVEGHTDAKGTDAANQTLSQRRAASVKRYLASLGIAASRMTTRGYGETRPVAPNTRGGRDNPAGRAKNRRVVVGAVLG